MFLIFALIILCSLAAVAQTDSLTFHFSGGPDLILRDVHIGATYQEINAFTARADAMLASEENVTWVHLALLLNLVTDSGTHRAVAVECSDCTGPLHAYFESSPWEAGHIRGFAIRAASGDYAAEKDLPTYSGWVALDASCYAKAIAQRASPSALAASHCIELTQKELTASVESDYGDFPAGAVMVALTSAAGEPAETHIGLVPRRLLRTKRVRVVVHVESR